MPLILEYLVITYTWPT